MSPKHQHEKDTEEASVKDGVICVSFRMIVFREFKVPNTVEDSKNIQIDEKYVGQNNYRNTLLVFHATLFPSFDYLVFISN